MNESLCDEDKLKQVHLTQVDFFIKQLFSVNRLPVDIFEKLMDLRQEEEDQRSKSTKLESDTENEDANFFLDGHEEVKLGEGENYEEEDEQDTKEIVLQRQIRYERDCAKGYFLQPIYVQKLKRKIYLYSDLVV